jgi:hypothetical protein
MELDVLARDRDVLIGQRPAVRLKRDVERERLLAGAEFGPVYTSNNSPDATMPLPERSIA